MRGGTLLGMKRVMIKLLKTILIDNSIKFTELADYGIRIDYLQQVNGHDLPGLLVVYERGKKLILHEKKACIEAMDMYIHLVLELKARNARVDGKLYRNVPTPEDCARGQAT